MDNIFRKLSSIANGLTGAYQEVARLLDTLSKSRRKVSVKFQGDSRTYTSAITAFNAEHKIFVLDNVFPPAPVDAFSRGRMVTIVTVANGKTVKLQSKVLEPLVANQNMGFELKVTGGLSVVEAEHGADYALLQMQRGNTAITTRKAAGF